MPQTTAPQTTGPEITRPLPAASRRGGRRALRAAAALTVTFLLAGVLGAVLQPGTAAALANGVNYVNFASNPYFCDGASLPTCLPDHGIGKANTIYVHQELVDGQYRYARATGTSTDSDDIWVQTTFSAQCGLRFRLNEAFMSHHGNTDASTSIDASSPGDGSTRTWPQPVDTSNRTIPQRNVALHQPVAEFTAQQWAMSPEELFQWGEDLVAEDTEVGYSEAYARTMGHTAERLAGLSATVTCRQISGLYAWAGNVDWRRTHSAHEIQIVFLPIGGEPGDEDQPGWRDAELELPPSRPEPAADDLVEGFRVDQVALSAIPDTEDACLLHLSGVVTTNGPGEVSYRFVDELGVGSQLFSVQVDQTQVAMLDHHIELEPVDLGTGLHTDGADPDGLVAPGDGGIGGYAQEQGDNVQGYYRIEVVEPHALLSDVASYNVDGCTVGGVAQIPTTRG